MLSSLTFSQTDGFENQSIMFDEYKQVENFQKSNVLTSSSYRRSGDNKSIAPGLIIGGATLLTAGLLTYTNRVDGTSKSIAYDLSKYLAIGSGAVLMGTGFIVISIK